MGLKVMKYGDMGDRIWGQFRRVVTICNLREKMQHDGLKVRGYGANRFISCI